MFYSNIFLTKKGPLAKIWLAAHWDKKVSKSQIFETDIEKSVEAILAPQFKLALRTSGHLLLGVVKIYDRRVKYLLSDVNEAIIRIKMAFRPGLVDLPRELSVLPLSSVTMPEMRPEDLEAAALGMVADDFMEIELPDEMVTYHTSRKEDITIREFEMPNLNLFNVDPYEDNFLTTPHQRQSGAVGDVPLEQLGEVYDDDLLNDINNFQDDFAPGGFPDKDGAAEEAKREALDRRRVSVRRKLVMTSPVSKEKNVGEDAESFTFNDDLDNHIRPLDDQSRLIDTTSALDGNRSVRLFESLDTTNAPAAAADDVVATQQAVDLEVISGNIGNLAPPANNPTTLVNNGEGFALGPIDITEIRTIRKAKRKRRLVVDEVTTLSSAVMAQNFSNTSDLIIGLDIAAPTKVLMNWKIQDSCDRMMMELPCHRLISKKLHALYKRNLITRPVADDEDGVAGGGAKETGPAEGENRRVDQPQQSSLPSDVSRNEVAGENSSQDNIEADDQSRMGIPPAGDETIPPAGDEVGQQQQPIEEQQPLQAADASLGGIDGPSFALEQSVEHQRRDASPRTSLAVSESRLTRSMTKENRGKRSFAVAGLEDGGTPKRMRLGKGMPLTTSDNFSPLLPPAVLNLRTPSRNQKTPVKDLNSSNLLNPPCTPQQQRTERSLNDSLALPPLDVTPSANRTRQFHPFDVSSTFSPLSSQNQLGTVPSPMPSTPAEDENVTRGRSQQEMIKNLQKVRASQAGHINFKDLVLLSCHTGSGQAAVVTRKKVASSFSALLELKKRGMVEVRQDNPMGNIIVTPRPPLV